MLSFDSYILNIGGHMKSGQLLGLYEKAFPDSSDLFEKLRATEELGFDFLEISIDESDHRLSRLYWTMEQKYELINAVIQSGVSINTMCLSAHRRFPFGSKDMTIRKKAREIVRNAIEFAAVVGIRVIQLAGYDVYYEESTDQTKADFLDGLRFACDLAEKHQVMLAIETMDTEFLCSVTRIMEYVKKINSRWLGVYPDIGNLSAWHMDLLNEFKAGDGSIVCMHVKDTLPVTKDFPGKFRSVSFGEGCVDFVDAFLSLEDINYCGPLMIEMWSEEGKDEKYSIANAKAFVSEKTSMASKLYQNKRRITNGEI